MIAPLLAAYYRLGNWLLPEVRRDPVLRKLPVVRWGRASVHLGLGGGEALALFGAAGARETAAQRLIRGLWTLNPLTTNFPGNTTDRQAYGQNATYATARSTVYRVSDNLTASNVGQYWNTAYFRVYRGLLWFVTSSIGAGATVTQANLRLVATTDTSAKADFDVEIAKAAWAGSSNQTDYALALSADLDAVWRNTAGMAINTAYTSPALDPTWIETTGATRYALRSSRDTAGTAPPTNQGDWAEFVGIGEADNTTAGYRPVLAVLYTVPVGASITRAPYWGRF